MMTSRAYALFSGGIRDYSSGGGGGEATRSGTEKRCSHNLQSGQFAGLSAAFQGGGVFSPDVNFGFER